MSVKFKIVQSSLVCGLLFGLLFPSFVLLMGPMTLTSRSGNSPQPSLIPIDIPKELQKQGKTRPDQLPSTGFIKNQGQLPDEEFQYYLNVGETTVYFGTSTIRFGKVGQQEGTDELSTTAYAIAFPGSAQVKPVGIDANAYSVNYIMGAGTWTDVPSFNAIIYTSLYPGIDLKYYLTPEGLKYEFLVHAGAEPDLIIIALEGVGALTVLPTKITSEGSYIDQGLLVYQADDTIVGASFAAGPTATSYSFNLGSYDVTQDLLIDPLVIDFSTYLGGSLDEGRGGAVGTENGLFVDDLGYIYVTGITLSTNFPVLGNLSGYKGNWDMFVTKFNPNGSALIYSTYIGGSMNEQMGAGIKVDAQGNAYVVGSTYSSDFPTVNPYQTDPDGTSFQDIVAFKLNSTGNGLNYSTYLGGTAQESGQGMAIDNGGNLYITGYSTSSNYPLKNQYQGYDGSCSAIITELNATGNGLIFSTYFGGSLPSEYGEAIALDASGNIYIGGTMQIYATGSNFPLKNPWDNTAPANYYEGFIACFNATGNGLNFSTYVGGALDDSVKDIKLGSDGCIYAVGSTASTADFPVKDAYQGSYGGGSADAFVLKLNSTGNGAIFSTYLGGNGADVAWDLSLTSENDIVLVGNTTSTNLVPVQALQNSYQGGSSDVFVTMLSTNGTSMKFNSYLGGNGGDYPYDVWVDPNNCTYIFGETSSTNFPTRNAYQNYQGGKDAFLTKILLDDPSVITPAGDFDYLQFSNGNQINWTITDPVMSNGNYTVFKNGSGWGSYVNQSWMSGVELHVNVDGLARGVYNFTILVDDGYGLNATDEVLVNVTGVAPVITGSSDFSYFETTTGHQINWTMFDLTVGPLANFSVFWNGSVWGSYENISWNSGAEIHVNVDGLPVGLQNLTIYALDGSGLNATDTVFVTVMIHTTNGIWQGINLGKQFITCYDMEVTFAEAFIQGSATGGHIKITAYASNPTTTTISNGIRFFAIQLDAPNTVAFPVTVQFYYNQGQLPQGVSEANLGIYHLVDGQWVLLDGTINTDRNTITVVCTSFSDFAIAPVSPAGIPWNGVAIVIWAVIGALLSLVILYFKMRRNPSKGNETTNTYNNLYIGAGGF